jgi:hypothetical protein
MSGAELIKNLIAHEAAFSYGIRYVKEMYPECAKFIKKYSGVPIRDVIKDLGKSVK